ncbi:MAG: S1C family serine protease [Candidatus Uhrbacteria bacterium]
MPRTLFRQPLAWLRTWMTQGGSHAQNRVGWILLTGAIGFVAGIAGGLIGMATLFPASLSTSSGIVRSGVMTRSSVEEFPSLAQVSAAVVDQFTVSKYAPTPTLIPLAQRSGRGIALTSDGWVMTVRSALDERGDQLPVVVSRDRRIHAVSRIALDPVSDLVFLAVPTLQVPVFPLRDQVGLHVGERLYAPTSDGGVVAVTLRSRRTRMGDETFRSSDRWDSLLAIDAATKLDPGTPVVDEDGALVGVVMDGTYVYPVELITSALPSLFKDGVVLRNTLGVTYRDLSEYAIAPDGVDSGALLAAPSGKRVFTSVSPFVGLVRAGETILAIGDDPLTARSLSALLQEYPLGAVVEVTVLGVDGVERTASVPLVKEGGDVLTVLPGSPR